MALNIVGWDFFSAANAQDFDFEGFLLHHLTLKLLNFGRRDQKTKFVFAFFSLPEIIITMMTAYLIRIHCCCCQSQLIYSPFVISVVSATTSWLRLVVQVLLSARRFATFIIVTKGPARKRRPLQQQIYFSGLFSLSFLVDSGSSMLYVSKCTMVTLFFL